MGFGVYGIGTPRSLQVFLASSSRQVLQRMWSGLEDVLKERTS
jgi:hypothetical protein